MKFQNRPGAFLKIVNKCDFDAARKDPEALWKARFYKRAFTETTSGTLLTAKAVYRLNHGGHRLRRRKL